MANRTFNTQQMSLAKKVVHLFPVVSVGAAGAVTLKKRNFSAVGAATTPSSSLGTAPTTGVGYACGDGAGVKSITRNSAGDWTLTLSDSYQYLLGAKIAQISNTSGTNAAGINGIAVNTTTTAVGTNTSLGSGGVVRVVLFAGTTATDPANGDTVTLHLILGDATEP